MPQLLTLENIQKYRNEHQDELKIIQQFKKWFESSEQINDEEAERMIQSLYQTTLFNLSLKPSPFTFDDQKKCVEHIILDELYELLFISQDHLDQDVELVEKMERMRMLSIDHFNLPKVFFLNTEIGKAMTYLSQINHKKTCYEKVECIHSFFRSIIYFNDETKQLNSDEVLEIIIYLIIHTASPLLYSNISFIRTCNFNISDENDYYLTQLEIAIQSILFSSYEKVTNSSSPIVSKILLSQPLSYNTSFLL